MGGLGAFDGATITNAMPDIPRLFTAICEWAACVTYLAVIHRRVTPQRTAAVAAVGLAAMIGVQYLAGAMPLWFWTLGMLLAFGCMWLIVWRGSGSGKREGLYVTARAFVLAELVASLQWQISTFLTYGVGLAPRQPFATLILIGVYAVCFAAAWAVERRNFSRSAPTTVSAQLAVGTVAITVVTFAMSNLSFVSTNTPFSGKIGQEVFYIRTLVDFCGFAILYAQQEQARRMEASAELASINAQLESQHQEYLASKENLESIGRLAHDLKHQIAALRAEVDPEHAAAGFEQLERSVAEYSAQQHSGNPVLDVILTTKTRVCEERGITFTAVADGALLGAANMSSMDIATLFGNALDNAIEATSRLDDPERRLIRLALYRQGAFTVIRVENYYDAVLRKDAAGDLRTTKRNATGHGFGVKSIRHIAAQYGGDVSITAEDHWFTLTVLIPER
ncbi:GHKL domain-containing protein [Bifidobacterium stellenboschense]|uniref:ATPase/histidine kinase/DNA gyrase B/HSP90 domain protein n=1 Tax=Bifidobacterium stellenboschense TaxID=762211 RepID=A0A087E0Z2_9BIFI|nr:GHKL domain-containing protein [Bifidobacterium stellenboschense]KFJ01443.1 ATPase/histidine kinase/DNA gyrase B/HSP90 domain protein [Bifidobacterium stellenboschense]